MSRAGIKTVRFTQVVERSGEPQVHTLWLPPEKDPELRRPQKNHRLMTVESSAAGTKTDIGTIGFEPTGPSPKQFLIFPKSLKPFDGARVVGIKFDLVAQPKLASVKPRQHSTVPPRHADKPTAAVKRVPTDKSTPATGESELERREDDTTKDGTESEVGAARLRQQPQVERKRENTDSRRHPRPSAKAEKSAAKQSKAKQPRTSEKSPDAAVLIREIRAALKDLKSGKSVAAYQRLERAVSEK